MLYFHHPSSLEHDPREFLPEHPDVPERITAIEAAMAGAGWPRCERRIAPEATGAELELVHSPRMVESLRGLCESGGGKIDEDTFVGDVSYRAALHAVGGACAMVRALIGGEASVAFSSLRPSGHHADHDRSMGFCLLNNVAVAAALAVAELHVPRVLIVDWDVHHGNGTADIFRRRADVLYASIHQRGLYPGTGAINDVGSGSGLGYTINVPVPAGSEEDVWLSVLEHLIIPAAREFAPQLILVSAGFDAHRRDPLGGCRLDESSFAQMACHVRELGVEIGAPVGAVLEGGYDPSALAASVLATIRALGGEGAAESAAPDQIVTPRAAAHLGHYWML